jgi:putative tricarboxylic transport membrane protein
MHVRRPLVVDDEDIFTKYLTMGLGDEGPEVPITRSGEEIADLPLGLQVKLLRAVEQKRFRPVGGTPDVQTLSRNAGERPKAARRLRMFRTSPGTGGVGMTKMLVGVLGLLVLLSGSPGWAQEYPSKVITLIVPFAAGGPTDTVGRLIARTMGTSLKQQIIVENVGGAGGTLGAGRVARAAGDGYTVLLHHIGQATAPALYRKLPYDPIKDFEPIGLVTDVPMTLVAKQDFPPKDLKELLTYVKANKAKVTYGNAGLGSASHLCGMLFMSTIETDLTTVPYKGTGPAMNDLLGGQIDLMCDQTTNTTSQIKANKIKVYGVTTKKRVASLPNVPTLHEAGLPGFEIAVWHALYAPKGTPKPVIDKLAAALRDALKDATVKGRYGELGTEPVSEDQAKPEALRAHLKAEIDRWGPIIKKAGVYAD